MKIELPEQKTQVFETRFSVRWGNMAAMGNETIAAGLFDVPVHSKPNRPCPASLL